MRHCEAYREKLGLNPKRREFINLVSNQERAKAHVHIYSDSLDLPIETICLAGASPESLFGSQTIPGLLLETLNTLRYRNGILFFDELDRILDNAQLLATLLPFLEPNAKQFYSPYLKRRIDVSHLFFIVAGNLDFKEEALKSRFLHLKHLI